MEIRGGGAENSRSVTSARQMPLMHSAIRVKNAKNDDIVVRVDNKKYFVGTIDPVVFAGMLCNKAGIDPLSVLKHSNSLIGFFDQSIA